MEKHYLKVIFFLLGFILVKNGVAQSQMPKIEGWRVHSSYVSNNCVEEVEDKIFVGNNSSIFTLLKEDNSVEIISRINGLSDVTVKFLRYDKNSKTLVVCYDNINIDLIQHDEVFNIRDILDKSIIGDKTVNNITIDHNLVYLSCSFGIVVIDIARKRLVDSYVNLGANGSNLGINDVAIFNGNIYAAANDGIYVSSLGSSNLSDYHSWSKAKSSTYSNFLEVYQSNLYGVVDSSIYTFDGNSWNLFNGLTHIQTSDMRVNNNQLVMTLDDQLVIVDKLGAIQSIPQKYARTSIIGDDHQLYLVVPDQYLIRMDLQNNMIDYLAPAGPYGTTATKMTYADNQLWIAAGEVNGFGIIGGWGPKYNNNKIYKFGNNGWYNFKNSNDSRMVNARDFIDVKINPQNKHAYFASFVNGIYEIDGADIVSVYDSTNSTLRPVLTGGPMNVSGLAFDDDNNMWVSNTDVQNPISVRTSEGVWKSFRVPLGVDHFGFITVDDAGNKWINSTRGQGIYVFNESGTLMNESDDQLKRLTKNAEEGLLPSEGVICVTKDQKGEMWIGTDQGLCILSNPENIFKQGANYDAHQIVIKTGLVYSNFLGTTPVNCITVDAANRKWIGTVNGAWLVSPDGYTVIKNFTMSNSPLLSNIINEIGIDGQTGEVFFATEKGMISFMGTATDAADTHGDVLVYPNPVKPDYSGLIAVKGLVNNAYVKITDISGHLVYETRANGGTATWNGFNFSGKRAATGVYLVYSSNQDGTETNVAKIVFIN
jgi:ligand-binding sensor domain-containing protein